MFSSIRENKMIIKCAYSYHTNLVEIMLENKKNLKMPIKLSYENGIYQSMYIKELDINAKYLEIECIPSYIPNQVYFDYLQKNFLIIIDEKVFEPKRYIPVELISAEMYLELVNMKYDVEFFI